MNNLARRLNKEYLFAISSVRNSVADGEFSSGAFGGAKPHANFVKHPYEEYMCKNNLNLDQPLRLFLFLSLVVIWLNGAKRF